MASASSLSMLLALSLLAAASAAAAASESEGAARPPTLRLGEGGGRPCDQCGCRQGGRIVQCLDLGGRDVEVAAGVTAAGPGVRRLELSGARKVVFLKGAVRAVETTEVVVSDSDLAEFQPGSLALSGASRLTLEVERVELVSVETRAVSGAAAAGANFTVAMREARVAIIHKCSFFTFLYFSFLRSAM